MTSNYYRVGGHVFGLSAHSSYPILRLMENYAPFRIAEGAHDTLFHLCVTDDLPAEEDGERIGRFDDDIASIGVFKTNDGYRFTIAPPGASGNVCTTLVADAAFGTAQARLSGNARERFFGLNNSLMMMYAFATAQLDTVLMHASVIQIRDEAFMFLGKSGTGKSTHSRLWLAHIEGAELLNDDNPVVRIIDGEAWVYGSPWSGKTRCYRNESATLRGIVKLRQAPENKITKLPVLQTYAALLPSCSSLSTHEGVTEGVHRTVEKLATSAGCYRLDCLPDHEAAELCLTTLNKNR